MIKLKDLLEGQMSKQDRPKTIPDKLSSAYKEHDGLEGLIGKVITTDRCDRLVSTRILKKLGRFIETSIVAIGSVPGAQNDSQVKGLLRSAKSSYDVVVDQVASEQYRSAMSRGDMALSWVHDALDEASKIWTRSK